MKAFLVGFTISFFLCVAFTSGVYFTDLGRSDYTFASLERAFARQALAQDAAPVSSHTPDTGTNTAQILRSPEAAPVETESLGWSTSGPTISFRHVTSAPKKTCVRCLRSLNTTNHTKYQRDFSGEVVITDTDGVTVFDGCIACLTQLVRDKKKD